MENQVRIFAAQQALAALAQQWSVLDDARQQTAQQAVQDLLVALQPLNLVHPPDLMREKKLLELGQLVGSVGHELRNPLAIIANAVNLLQDEAASQEASGIQEYWQLIGVEVQRIEKIVGDLLDYARVRPANQSPTDISALVYNALERMSPPDHVQVVVDLPDGLPPILIDAQQITQVLINLLSNAYEAMLDEGVVTIGIQFNAAGTATLSIHDTGPGIAPGDLSHVFEPLFTTKEHGIGFGLAISKSLVEAGNGILTVESQPGQGATFFVTLPLA